MDYIILAVCCLYIGWKVNDIFTRITFGKMLEEAGVTDKDLDKFMKHWKPKMEAELESSPEQNRPEVAIKIEKHGEMLYAFKVENDEFIGQGKTKEELLEVFKKRFNNVTFTVSQENGLEYIQS